jgi:hypothetical protein
MTEGKKPRTRRPKPLLAAAFFCDKVLEGDNDAMSAITIRDIYTVVLAPGDLAHPDQRVPVSLNALLGFKSGKVTEDRTLQLVLKSPARKKKVVYEHTLPFRGGEQGVNIKVNVRMQIKTQGLYWMDVVVDGARLTSMPLKIVFMTMEQFAQMGQPHSESS